MESSAPDRFLSASEAAEYLGITRQSFHAGNPPEPAAVIGRAKGWTVEQLDEWNLTRRRPGRYSSTREQSMDSKKAQALRELADANPDLYRGFAHAAAQAGMARNNEALKKVFQGNDSLASKARKNATQPVLDAWKNLNLDWTSQFTSQWSQSTGDLFGGKNGLAFQSFQEVARSTAREITGSEAFKKNLRSIHEVVERQGKLYKHPAGVAAAVSAAGFSANAQEQLAEMLASFSPAVNLPAAILDSVVTDLAHAIEVGEIPEDVVAKTEIAYEAQFPSGETAPGNLAGRAYEAAWKLFYIIVALLMVAWGKSEISHEDVGQVFAQLASDAGVAVVAGRASVAFRDVKSIVSGEDEE